METNVNMSQVVDEIKSASEEELKRVIEQRFEVVRTQGMKIDAQFISAAVMGVIEKNLKNGMNSSHRDFERAIKKVVEIVSVQLKQETVQNDLNTEDAVDDE